MSGQAAALPRPRSGRQTNLIAVATLCSGSKKRQGQRRKELLCIQTPTSSLIPVHCSPALNHVAGLPGFPTTTEEEKRSAAIAEEVVRDFWLNIFEILADTLWGIALWFKFHKWIEFKNPKHKVQFLKNQTTKEKKKVSYVTSMTRK